MYDLNIESEQEEAIRLLDEITSNLSPPPPRIQSNECNKSQENTSPMVELNEELDLDQLLQLDQPNSQLQVPQSDHAGKNADPLTKVILQSLPELNGHNATVGVEIPHADDNNAQDETILMEFPIVCENPIYPLQKVEVLVGKYSKEPTITITNQPINETRVRHLSESNFQMLHGKNNQPITLEILNANPSEDWTVVTCVIENNIKEYKLHSNGLHFRTENKKDFQGIVCIPFQPNKSNNCHLEMQFKDVFTHRLRNDHAAKIGLKKIQNVLEQRHCISVNLPKQKNYKSPDHFRLLFSIMRQNQLFQQLISDPIRNMKSKPPEKFKVTLINDTKIPIPMTETRELMVLLTPEPDDNDCKITARFSYSNPATNEVIMFPENEIELGRKGKNVGVFKSPLFPTPTLTENVNAKLICRKYYTCSGVEEETLVEGVTFKPPETFKIIHCDENRQIPMSQPKRMCMFLEMEYNVADKVTARFSYRNVEGQVILFPEEEIEVRIINKGGGLFDTPLFPTPYPVEDVTATLICRKYGPNGIKEDTMGGFTFTPTTLKSSGKRVFQSITNEPLQRCSVQYLKKVRYD